ncbi:MAG: hypothetical protein ACJARS_003872 [bacterium]
MQKTGGAGIDKMEAIATKEWPGDLLFDVRELVVRGVHGPLNRSFITRSHQRVGQSTKAEM